MNSLVQCSERKLVDWWIGDAQKLEHCLLSVCTVWDVKPKEWECSGTASHRCREVLESILFNAMSSHARDNGGDFWAATVVIYG